MAEEGIGAGTKKFLVKFTTTGTGVGRTGTEVDGKVNSVVRSIVVAGMLGGVAILLAVTRLGMIPMPTGINATIMHIPAILGGVVEGPGVGALVGLIFGLYSFLNSGGFFSDPLVSILPRLLIGPAAYGVRRVTGSVALAAALGTATNTVGVLGMAVLRGYLPAKAAGVIALSHGLPEIVVAVVLVVPIARALARWRGGPSAPTERIRKEQGEET